MIKPRPGGWGVLASWQETRSSGRSHGFRTMPLDPHPNVANIAKPMTLHRVYNEVEHIQCVAYAGGSFISDAEYLWLSTCRRKVGSTVVDAHQHT